MFDLKTIQQAIKQIAAEKGLAEDSIMETINSALAAAYRKDFGHKNQNIFFEFDPKTGKMKVVDKKTVVDFPPEIIAEIDENGRDKKYVKGADEEELETEKDDKKDKENKEEKESAKDKQKKEDKEEKESAKDKQKKDEAVSEEDEDVIRFNPKTEILLDDAKKIKKSAKVGDEIVIPLKVEEEFGRMAAQTAKQVIIQKIREAERDFIFNEFKDKQGELLVGVIQRRDPRGTLIDLTKATALMPFEEQIRVERYNPGDRMKFYVKSVEQTIKGPEIIVSRASAELVRKLFETEIPEIASDAIDIKAVSREAGSRSKVAVKSNQENIDPIGSCVGQRGARIQTIINELGGEKIDIIEWDEDPAKFITNSLSPAKVSSIEIDKKEQAAAVTVNEDQLSLAIGKEGQNVRLAAKLTGWKINIIKETASGKKEKIDIEGDEASAKSRQEKEEKSDETEDKKSAKKEDKKEDKKTAKKKTDKKEEKKKEKAEKKEVKKAKKTEKKEEKVKKKAEKKSDTTKKK